ncbi:VC0807 family protein [Sphingomonas sp.]|uniref:VC0807 family protein n=1 Tax=Sphingomonas sp. TaxID=28214 RepID=UPI002E31A686|nr:VC0807 family protein [Sphingomonas sp.]HEX4695232.1 VC0807 family protein [Sphingomonas sp.]
MDEKSGRIAGAVAWLRNNGGHVLVEALVNFILPYAIYTYAEAPLGEVKALVASSAPPTLWSLIEFARHRRIDALSVLVLSGIVLSLLAMLGGGGPQFLLLREKLVTGAIGLVFLGSALIGKPLVYELARASMRRKSEDQAQEFEALRVHAAFRRTMTVMTLVWGFGLIADVTVAVALVFTLSVREYLIVNPILGYGTMGALTLWSFLYARRARRRGEARRAAAEAEAVGLEGAAG